MQFVLFSSPQCPRFTTVQCDRLFNRLVQSHLGLDAYALIFLSRLRICHLLQMFLFECPACICLKLRLCCFMSLPFPRRRTFCVISLHAVVACVAASFNFAVFSHFVTIHSIFSSIIYSLYLDPSFSVRSISNCSLDQSLFKLLSNKSYIVI